MNESHEKMSNKDLKSGSNEDLGRNQDETSEKVSETLENQSLKERVSELENQLKEKDAKYLYLYADFENFKKRSIKERSDLLKFGWESVARELLHTLDNLERTLAHTPPNTDKVWLEGLGMTFNQFKGALQKHGIQQIESVQKDFDPNLHEAVGQERSELPSGKIVTEHEKGYTLHSRLLRAARVTISDGQGATGPLTNDASSS